MSAELYEGFDRFAIRLAREDEDDWLSVSVDVRSGNRVWSDTDACLSRAEASRLADWFDALEGDGAIGFEEGNLRFERLGPALRIDCDLEFAPPNWDDVDNAFVLALKWDAVQATAFARDLRAQLDALDSDTIEANQPLIPPSPIRRPMFDIDRD